MCIGGAKAQPLPPTPPAAPTMADPSVQKARDDTQRQLAGSGLSSTQLTVNLGGSGAGEKKLAGSGAGGGSGHFQG